MPNVTISPDDFLYEVGAEVQLAYEWVSPSGVQVPSGLVGKVVEQRAEAYDPPEFKYTVSFRDSTYGLVFGIPEEFLAPL